jgi:hypothetical protein
MVKGFILLRLVPGLESDTLSHIRTVPGVSDLTLVFGGWDAIVQAEAKTLSSLTRLVVGQIRGIQGVQATETLVAAEL